MRPQSELSVQKKNIQALLEKFNNHIEEFSATENAIGQDGRCHWWWNQQYFPGLPKRCCIFLSETKYLHSSNGGLHLKMSSSLKILNQYFHKNYFPFGEPRRYNDDYTGSQVTEPSLALLLFLFPCISITAHIHNVLCNHFLVIVLTRSPVGKRVTRVNISVLLEGEPQI